MDRSQDRHGRTKAFSYDNNSERLLGKSNEMLYNSHPEYQEVSGLHTQCVVYATCYTETMLQRAKVEDPGFFAKKGISKEEL